MSAAKPTFCGSRNPVHHFAPFLCTIPMLHRRSAEPRRTLGTRPRQPREIVASRCRHGRATIHDNLRQSATLFEGVRASCLPGSEVARAAEIAVRQFTTNHHTFRGVAAPPDPPVMPSFRRENGPMRAFPPRPPRAASNCQRATILTPAPLLRNLQKLQAAQLRIECRYSELPYIIRTIYPLI